MYASTVSMRGLDPARPRINRHSVVKISETGAFQHDRTPADYSWLIEAQSSTARLRIEWLQVIPIQPVRTLREINTWSENRLNTKSSSLSSNQ